MIEFKNISKKYRGQPKNAVDAFTLRIESGHICVLLGPSGCGKTTTLRTVNRMVDIDSGSVLIDGQNINLQPKEELRKKIGYVIQSIGLFPHLNVERNIGIVLKLLHWDKERRHARVTELLNLIGLPPDKYRYKYPHELSGGEAQRIGVARALAAGQNILLMDEPFGAVDPLRRDVFTAGVPGGAEKTEKDRAVCYPRPGRGNQNCRYHCDYARRKDRAGRYAGEHPCSSKK